MQRVEWSGSVKKHLGLLRFEGGCLRLHIYLPALIIAYGGIKHTDNP